jgi:hypothetical protein
VFDRPIGQNQAIAHSAGHGVGEAGDRGAHVPEGRVALRQR